MSESQTNFQAAFELKNLEVNEIVWGAQFLAN
jgi:hypothetical protein